MPLEMASDGALPHDHGPEYGSPPRSRDAAFRGAPDELSPVPKTAPEPTNRNRIPGGSPQQAPPTVVRSATEQKLIARGRYLLQSYQQRRRERRDLLEEMCLSPPESALHAPIELPPYAPPSLSSPVSSPVPSSAPFSVAPSAKPTTGLDADWQAYVHSLRGSLEHVVQDHGRLEQELRRCRATIDRLEEDKRQMEKAASDKRTLLHRAYVVKTKQLDALCDGIALPPAWERVTDEAGIVYYRRTDRACGPELEDPRVEVALERFNPPNPSPRSAGGRMEQTVTNGGRKRSSASSFDSSVSCEDIAVPPDDGQQHQVEDFATPLPEGWEMRVTTAGSVFFVNRHTNMTTWKDPRRLRARGAAANASLLEKRQSAPPGLLQHLRVEIPPSPANAAPALPTSTSAELAIPEKSPMGAIEPSSGVNGHASGEEAAVKRFEVVFEEKGPIGIHFQANVPDAGATVRRLLPRMAAARTHAIESYDRLVAVNKNPVDEAPFRHVMLLLQGGLRPLTLTFERNSSRSTMADEGVQGVERAPGAGELDEEMAVDEPTTPLPAYLPDNGAADHLGELRPRRRSSTASSEASSEFREEDYSFADRIITNVFSLFWSAPEPPRSQVETV